MAQHDYSIANQGFPAFRSDLNDALAAIVSNNSGATEPTTMFAHQIWVDTAANPSILKIRNADNDAWITIGSLNQTADTFTLTSAVSATTLNTSGQVVFNDAGADVDFRVEGDTDANLLFVDASADAIGIGTSSPSTRLEVLSGVANTEIARFGGSLSARGLQISSYALGGVNEVGYEFNAPGAGGFSAISFATLSTERMSITASGFLRMASGSGGIQFNGDTAAANALDDYEEGTWSPGLSGGTTTTYTRQSGNYTKIGNLVFIRGSIIIASLGNGSVLQISGLPFSGSSAPGAAGTLAVSYFENLATNQIFITGYKRDADALLDFHALASAAAIMNSTPNLFQANARIDFAGCYII